ncbi:MAG: 4-hydroxybenzoate polyprenyltransferase [Paraglaciecola sp.]|jgi:4-hydroxybenzoate polyprenyltransferase
MGVSMSTNLFSPGTLRGLWQLTRADKPVGIYLLLWPTLWALFLAAQGLPDILILLVFVSGVVLMRSAGCVINDYADRAIDGSVERTAQRPLVTRTVSEKQALGLFAVLVLLAFLLVLTLNWQTILLSSVALILASCYPFMKRYTHLPQVVLGAAFGWAIPMACMAVTEQVAGWGWALFAANILWTVAYDTQYAMVDRDDDIKIGVKSTALLFGQYDRLIIALLQLGMVLVLAVIGYYLGLHWPYFSALVVVAGLFVYQQKLIWRRTRQGCFKAFLNNNYVGLAIVLGIIGHFALPTG